ncbi:TonB-dependent receptor [Luteimonas terrae]|uniref:TonB-dependent receptor n=1 Tax=Luteimonas terrae TaxID=1530191 RepID=A0ABU1XXS1_9GAMM|nr:TonB-dependent receptor [Luteimonas terrae]MDR7193559.1 TonB-dependent receptor [Luteimonas terrae]
MTSAPDPHARTRTRHRMAMATLAAAILATPVFAQTSPAPVCDPDAPIPGCTPADADAPSNAPATEDASVDTLDAVQVRGVRASVAGALDAKRASPQITDSIVAEDIGKLPDNSVAAAMQRITGVQVARGGAEVGTVLVRGLPNVVTTLNGRNIFTTTGRGVALADIPADQLQQVDVYKTSGAEQIEGGIAGAVDIRLRRPFDFEDDSTVAGSVSSLYADQARETATNGSLTGSTQWDTGVGRMGVLGTVSYQETPYLESNTFHGTYDRVENPLDPSRQILVPYNAGNLQAQGLRRRKAANVAFQWQPSERTELWADGFYTGYRNRPRVNYWMPFPGSLSPQNTEALSTRPGTDILQRIELRDSDVLSSTQAHENSSDTWQAALGGSWKGERLKLSTELAYTYSESDNRSMVLDANTTVPRLIVDSSDGVPFTSATNADGSAVDVTDPSAYLLSQYYDSWSRQEGDEWAWRGDANFAFDSGIVSSIDAGVRLARRQASNIGGDPGAQDNLSGAAIRMSDIPGLSQLSPGNILDGDRDVGIHRWVGANRDFLLGNTALIRQAMGQSPERPGANPAMYFDNREDNDAAYVQANYGFTLGSIPVDGRLGVRHVRLERALNGTSLVDGVETPVQNTSVRTEWLPSFSANLSLREDLMLRVSHSQSVSLPQFADLNPQLALFESTDTLPARGSGGNPDLAPVESKNFDASLEWYFQDNALLSLAAFHRDVDGYVQIYAEDERIDGTTYQITRPRNTGSGTLRGVEVGYTQFYDFLPGALSGLGTQLNATWIDAEAESPDGVMQPLANVSRRAWNAVLMYEYEAFSARLAYNWRDDYAVSFSASGDQPSEVFHGPETFVDLALNYAMDDNITVFMEATNLLGSKTHNYFGSPEFLRDRASPERTYMLGVRFRL